MSTHGSTQAFATRNMSTRSRAAAAALLLAAVQLALAGAGPSGLTLQGREFKYESKRIAPSEYSKEFRQLADGADLLPIPSYVADPSAALVVVRHPTKRLPLSRCGAGNEDQLAIVRHQAGRLMLVDRIELQSCEKGINLVTEDLSIATDPASAIRVKSNEISFDTTSPNAESPRARRLWVTGGGFVEAK